MWQVGNRGKDLPHPKEQPVYKGNQGGKGKTGKKKKRKGPQTVDMGREKIKLNLKLV